MSNEKLTTSEQVSAKCVFNRKAETNLNTQDSNLKNIDFERLLNAVKAIYYADSWRSNKLGKQKDKELWTELRDAAGFEPGHSPK